MQELVERRVLSVACDRMGESAVLALQGARSVGKVDLVAFPTNFFTSSHRLA